jgi:acyl carrier protein
VPDDATRVRRVVADVLGVDAATLSDDSNPDTVPSWDSLAHLNLVVALEQEFGVALSPDDVLEMMSMKLITLILRERGALAG